MAKKKKKKNNKKRMAKIFKLTGIFTAAIIGVLGLSVGIYALFGGFNKKVVSLTGMAFEKTAYVLDGNLSGTDGVFDTSIKLIPENEDATKLNVELSGGNNIVNLPTGNSSQVGKSLNLQLITDVDASGLSYNRGGEFTLTALQEEDMLTTSTKVFVESRVNSFNLITDLEDGEKIYPGSKFIVSVDKSSILPASALNKPRDIEFYNIYGQNYFNKQVLFYSSNESVAKVDVHTGEVEVLQEGEFTIEAYMATTYKNSSNLPRKEDFNMESDYFTALGGQTQDGQALTILETINFEVNSIDITGIVANPVYSITSSNTQALNAFNLYVKNTYTYVVGANNNGTNQINLDLNLTTPVDFSNKDELIKHRLQDVQLFEGYRDINGNLYISKNQGYNEVTGLWESTYFNIKQNKNPLYWEITPIDYTSSKDLYLIARISNAPLEAVGIDDYLVENSSDDDNYAYYVAIDINTEIISTTTVNAVSNKILTSFNGNDTDKYLLLNGEKLNLKDLISEILPANSTYNTQLNEDGSFKHIKFVVTSNTANEAGFTAIIDDEGLDATTGKGIITFKEITNDDGDVESGYFVNVLKEGEVHFYISVIKTDRNGENEVELARSEDIALFITQDINFSDLKVNNEPLSNPIQVDKGNSVEITFKADNYNGFVKANAEGFFTIESSSADKVSISTTIVEDASSNNALITIRVDALNEGSTSIYIKFNSKVIEIEGIESKIDLNIINNALKSIELSGVNSVIDFILSEDEYEDGQLVLASSLNGNQFLTNDTLTLPINLDGNAGELTVSVVSSTYADITGIFEIIGTEYKELKITPPKFIGNIQFSITDDSSGISSPLYTITITADYVADVTYKNSITIGGVVYEQVIANPTGNENLKFNFDTFLTYKTSTGENTWSSSFFIKSEQGENSLFNGSNFLFVSEPTTCQVKVKPTFSEEFEIYNFLILPECYVLTDTIAASTGDTLQLDDGSNNDLNSKVHLYQRSYNNEIIESSEIDPTSINIFETKDATTGVLSGEIVSSYTVPENIFNQGIVTLYCKVNDEYENTITIVVTSSLQIKKVSDYLNNGENVDLKSLFKVYKTSASEDVEAELTVILTQETIENLNQKAFNFFDEAGNELTYTNALNNPSNVAKILVPEDLNDYKISNLTAKIIANIGGNENEVLHTFDLDFKISRLNINSANIYDTDNNQVINENDTIYLLASDIDANSIKNDVKNNLINIYISSKSATTQNGVADDEVQINLKENNIIEFKLNSISKIFKYASLREFVSQKAGLNLYVGKTYDLESLVDRNNNLPELNSSQYYIKSLSATDISSNDYSLEAGKLIVKTSKTYDITISVLGRDVVVEDFEFANDGLELNKATFNNNKVYSNSSYELLSEETRTLLTNNQMSYRFNLLDNSGNELNNAFVTIDDYTLKIGNYNAESTTFKVKVEFFESGYTGVVEEIEFTLHSLIITQTFTNTIILGNETREVILDGLPVALNNYFTVSTTDEIGLSYKIDEVDKDEVEVDITAYTPNFNANTSFDLVVLLETKVEVARIKFYAEYFTLEAIPDDERPSYYAGQTIYKEDLMQVVKFVGNGNATSKYNSLLEFYVGIEKVDGSGKQLAEGGTTFTAKIGNSTDDDLIEEFTLTGKAVSWTYVDFNGARPLYNDSKVSNYVVLKIGDVESGLDVNYEYCDSNGITTTENVILVGNIYNRYDNAGVLISTLNKLTGELTITKDHPAGYAYVKAFIKEAPTKFEKVTFPVTNITAGQEANTTIYIGDTETDLTQYVCYSLNDGSNNKINGDKIKFQIEELIISNASLKNAYSYQTSTALNRDIIYKNGKIVGYVENNKFYCTSELDEIQIKLYGYVNYNLADYVYSGKYFCEVSSLKTNTLNLMLALEKIDISFDFEGQVQANGETYYVINTADKTEYVISPTVNGETDSLSALKFNTEKSAFIGSVSDITGFATYYIPNISEDNIKMPSLNEINISNPKIYWPQALTENIFFTIRYTYQTYSANLNIVLIPKIDFGFKYDSTSTNYATVICPGEYVLTDSTILFSNITPNDFSVNNFDFLVLSNIEEEFDTTDSFSRNINNNTYKQKIEITQATNAFKLSVLPNSAASPTASDITALVLRISYEKTFEDSPKTAYYYYKLLVNPIDIKVYNNAPDIIDEGDNPTENTSTNKIVIENGTTEIDLYEYIYINGVRLKLGDDNNETYNTKVANCIDLLQISSNEAEGYIIENNRTLKLISSISENLNVDFVFNGYTYTIYFKTETVSSIFKFNNNEVDSYNLTNKTYYVYISSSKTAEETTVTTNILETVNNSLTSNSNCTFIIKNLSYIIAGTTSTSFTTNVSGNTTTYSFGGLPFVELTNNSNYYTLKITENVTGKLEFDIQVQYSLTNFICPTKVELQDIVISYNNPSVYNGVQYQNMIVGSTLNVANFVSVIGSLESPSISYSLKELSTVATISAEGFLTTFTNDIYNEVFLVVKVKYNNIIKYFNVRIVPNVKVEVIDASLSFTVLKDETIDLTKYAKVYKFSGYDAQNEPMYNQVLNYCVLNENVIDDAADDTYDLVDYSAYKISKSSNIYIRENNETLYTLTFNVVELTFEKQECYEGETLNLKTYVQTKIDESSLTIKNGLIVEFSDTNNFVTTDGSFTAKTAGTYTITVTINGIEHTLEVIVNDLSITLTYSNAVLEEDATTFVATKYQNLYATQEVATDTHINVEGGDVRLGFNIEPLSSSGYNINELKTQTNGEYLELVDVSSNVLFSISENKIICYSHLNYELKLRVNIFVEDNLYVENSMNFRLLPVELSVKNGGTLDITTANTYKSGVYYIYELINNMVSATTKTTENNIALNDKITFESFSESNLTAIDGQLQTSSLYDELNKVVKISTNTQSTTLRIVAVLGQGDNSITRTITINYINTETASALSAPLFADTGIDLLENDTDSIVSVGTNENNYTYTKNLSGIITYDVFDSNGSKLLNLNVNGVYTLFTTNVFTITLSAYNGVQTTISEVTFNAGPNWALKYDEFNGSSTVVVEEENGVKYLSVLSGDSFEIPSDFLRGGLVDEGSILNVYYSETGSTKTIKAETVNTITYGYFDATNGTQTFRVYVKIYPYSIVKNYTEDYTYDGADQNAGQYIVLQNNDKFKDILIYNSITIDLDELVSFSSDFAKTKDLNFAISKVYYFSEAKYNLIAKTSEDEPNFSAYCSLQDNELTLKPNSNYYVDIAVKVGADQNTSEYIKLRVLKVEDKTSITSLIVNCGDIIELDKVINVYATNIDEDENLKGVMSETKYNLLDDLTLSLSGHTYSYIENNLLYILDDNCTIGLTYSYNNMETKSIQFEIKEKEDEIYYIHNGKNYTEQMNDELNNLGEISGVVSVVINNGEYVPITDTRKECLPGETEATNVKYYIVNNLIEICETGEVKFFDSSIAEFVETNNIGIFYVCVIKELQTEENFVYGYREEYYKLNNYTLTENSYSVNGVDRSDLLRYTIIGENGMSIDGTIAREETVTSNGITINILTGETSGTKIDPSIKMYKKVYVQDEYTFYGENYILLEIII